MSGRLNGAGTRSRRTLGLVKPVDALRIALADRVAADLEARGHLAVLDTERLVGERELAHFLDHREVLVGALERGADGAAVGGQLAKRGEIEGLAVVARPALRPL